MPGRLEHHAQREERRLEASRGFGLVEALMSLFIMSFGMLAIAQLLFVALGAPALAASKGAATLAAQDRLDFLAEAYRQNPEGPDLVIGNHGPLIVEVRNPNDGALKNRYSVSWSVSAVPDPRPWRVVHAKLATVTVTPVGTDGNRNDQAALNKVISVSSIFSAKPE